MAFRKALNFEANKLPFNLDKVSFELVEKPAETLRRASAS